ncbi:MAG TPA: ATP synthase F0 subunit B, partial [Coxiellaceae bacterium]|nr:ATP synthase F0 subunit B [Coxiellaceae bacterium]
MNINLTLFGEMLTFAILVWVIMKYIWPPLMKAIQERQEKIAAGLEAAQRGQRELKLIQTNAAEQIHQAKIKASTILDQANQQATAFIEEG